MRPTRLELSGFASFRDPCTIDFGDADLFVLSGSTGAGKSSVVDSMVFALYGAVPRYGDRRRVEPVINKTADEARVRLDFTVEGDAFTAVRVVRRTANGATTKEARLEQPTPSGPRSLAGTADEVSQQVERLLGLSFEHFTTCVVLPQGEFQRFLHATGKQRQDLLVELLDLDVYREVGRRARARAGEAGASAQAIERRLDGELAGATSEARTDAAARVTVVEDLQARIESAQPELEQIRDEGSRLRASHDQAQERRARLDAVQLPTRVTELAQRLGAAREAVTAADEALTAATVERESAEHEQQALPDAGLLREVRARLTEHDQLDARHAAATEAASRAEREAAGVREAAARATQAVTDARERLDHAQQTDLAATLAAGLHAGDDCPVCARRLDDDPQVAGTDDVEAARASVRDAEAGEREAASAVRAADQAHTRTAAELDTVAERREVVSAALAELHRTPGLPHDAATVDEALAGAHAAHERVTAARQAEREARRRREQASSERERLSNAREQAWTEFYGVRDRVAVLEPPPVPRDDLQAAWEQLTGWARDRAESLDTEVAAAKEAVDDAVRRWQQRHGELRRACGEVGLDDRGDPVQVCAAAVERERGRLQHLDEQLETASKLRDELRTLRHDERVARSLGDHLHATRFERWLLNRALRLLMVGASRILHDLTAGAYSLALDEGGGFEVVDHRNVDTRRPARTLSGGETFLASLALALALAEQVADFAAHGSARLESLFLDEGFGTLDADTLDTVAAAIEELGARGRMVGLITHVRDLAERMPVRFEVAKVGGCSQVVRIEPRQADETTPVTTPRG